MSCRTIVYKGMLNASQLLTFYPDLHDGRFEAPLALVHSRFSTNTFPSWDRAHPYRYISHNGEINTLRGNVNWIFARQSTFRSSVFGDDLQKVLPAVDVDGSDTQIFDNVLELLHLSGRSLAHVMMMMVPEPWGRNTAMSAERRAFYEYHSCLMEPWDGPASLAFTDGIRIGATLDRNGLRPGRYWVTRDGRVVMASEAGVLDIPPGDVIEKGRLQPGRMFLVDTAQGRIIPDEELKAEITGAEPYEDWVRDALVRLEDLPAPTSVIGPDHETVLRRQHVSGADDVAVTVLGTIQPINQPWLAAKLCRHPAGGVRDERERKRQHQYPEQSTTRFEPSAEALEVGDSHHGDEDRAQAGHDVKGVVQELDVRRPGLRRKRIQSAHVSVEGAVCEEAEHAGNLDRVVDTPRLDVRLADDCDLRHRTGPEAPLHRGEHRLLVAGH